MTNGLLTAVPGTECPGEYASLVVVLTDAGQRSLGFAPTAISSLAVTSDRRTAVIGTRSEGVFVVDAENGSVRHHLARAANFADWVTTVTVSPDDRRVCATSRRQVKVFSLDSGALDFAVGRDVLSGWASACFVGPEALLLGSDNGAWLTQRDKATRLATPHAQVSKVAASARGEKGVVFFGGVALWSASGERRLVRLADVQSLAFSADGRFVLLARKYGVVEAVDVESGARLGHVTVEPFEPSDSINAQALCVEGDRAWLRHASGLTELSVSALTRQGPTPRTPRTSTDAITWSAPATATAGDWKPALERWLAPLAPTEQSSALLRAVIGLATSVEASPDESLTLCFDTRGVDVRFSSPSEPSSSSAHFPPTRRVEVSAGSESLTCRSSVRARRPFDSARYDAFAASEHLTALLDHSTGAVALLHEEGEPVPSTDSPGEVVLGWLADRLGLASRS